MRFFGGRVEGEGYRVGVAALKHDRRVVKRLFKHRHVVYGEESECPGPRL